MRRLVPFLLIFTSALLAAFIALGRLMPDEGRLAFSDSRLKDILLLDIRTRIVANLTRTPTIEESTPAWSPDGQQIAFTSDQAGVPGSGSAAMDLYVMRADGRERRRLTTTGAAYPVWSPDGTEIAFYSTAYLSIIGIDGTGARHLPRGVAPDWTEEGLRARLVGADVAVVPPHGSASLSAFQQSPTLSISDPVWSGDRRHIAFAAWDGVSTRVYLLPADCLPECGGIPRLVPAADGARLPTLSPDGVRLAFVCLDDYVLRNNGIDAALCLTDGTDSAAQLLTAERYTGISGLSWRPG